MNNVRTDGKGCPVFYRCFSCRFFTTDFTNLSELRDLRTAKAEQLAKLQAGYGTVLRRGPLADANLQLISAEISQFDRLISKCRLISPPLPRRTTSESSGGSTAAIATPRSSRSRRSPLASRSSTNPPSTLPRSTLRRSIARDADTG